MKLLDVDKAGGGRLVGTTHDLREILPDHWGLWHEKVLGEGLVDMYQFRMMISFSPCCISGQHLSSKLIYFKFGSTRFYGA